MIVVYILLLIIVLTPMFVNFFAEFKMQKLAFIIRAVNAVIPNINYGGCGWFALYLHQYLNRKGIKNEIIFLSFTGKKVPRHVVVRVGNAYIDNKFFYTRLSMWLFSGGDIKVATEEQLIHSLVGSGWNQKFNRMDSIRIKKIFELY